MTRLACLATRDARGDHDVAEKSRGPDKARATTAWGGPRPARATTAWGGPRPARATTAWGGPCQARRALSWKRQDVGVLVLVPVLTIQGTDSGIRDNSERHRAAGARRRDRLQPSGEARRAHPLRKHDVDFKAVRFRAA